jgi:hypothetical protein
MKSIVIVLFCILSTYMYPQETFQSKDNLLSTYRENSTDGYSWRKREISYSVNDDSVSKKKLLSTIWVSDPLENMQPILVFFKDDIFKIGTRQAGVDLYGKYEINGKSINLIMQTKNSQRIAQLGMNSELEKCSISKSSNLFFYDQLVVGKHIFYPIGSERKNGEVLTYENINIIKENVVKVMSDNVNFREKPNVNAKKIQVEQYSEVTNEAVFSLKKGTVVELIARTKQEELIDGIKSSWYFIRIFDGYEGSQFGWVFGGSFTEYKKENEKDYWDLVIRELKTK